MASASSQQKNVTSSEQAHDLSRLLQSRAGLEPVSAAVVSAAQRLSDLGVISFVIQRYVRCALTEDRDFTHSNRACSGRLVLDDGLDENGGDYRCAECGRMLYPIRSRKRQFEELRVRVIRNGVESFVGERLNTFGKNVQPVAGVPGAWRVNAGVSGVHVCLADYCDHQRFMSVQWAQHNPTCYVAVNPRALERFADVEWLGKVMLSDLIAGIADLPDIVRRLGANDVLPALPLLATPAYSKGAHRPETVSAPCDRPVGLFVIELSASIVRVNDVDVLATQAHAAREILHLLAEVFTQDVLNGRLPDDFRCQTPSEMADSLKAERKKRSSTGRETDAIDPEQVRRTINRLQDLLEDRLRRAGIAAERDDIIQTAPNTVKEGYRLNPFKVAIRPLVASGGQN